jgi:hypothetical protein
MSKAEQLQEVETLILEAESDIMRQFWEREKIKIQNT